MGLPTKISRYTYSYVYNLYLRPSLFWFFRFLTQPSHFFSFHFFLSKSNLPTQKECNVAMLQRRDSETLKIGPTHGPTHDHIISYPKRGPHCSQFFRKPKEEQHDLNISSSDRKNKPWPWLESPLPPSYHFSQPVRPSRMRNIRIRRRWILCFLTIRFSQVLGIWMLRAPQKPKLLQPMKFELLFLSMEVHVLFLVIFLTRPAQVHLILSDSSIIYDLAQP